MELKDFGSGSISPEDFANGMASMGVTLGSKTTSQAAASQTLLQGSPTIEGYKELNNSLSTPQGRETFYKNNIAIREKLISNPQNSLNKILMDNDISDEQKLSYIEASRSIKPSYSPSSMTTLSENALVADSSEDETDSEAQARISLLDISEEVSASKRRMQARINGLNIGKDAGVVSTLTDIGELMAPFAEWIHYDNLLRDVTDPNDDRAILMGNQKEQIYEKIQSMPLEQKEAVLSSIMTILDNNENVILPDGNDLVKLETLERMFIDNDYSSFEKNFDNITSILDIIGVGTVARSAIKAPAKASRAAKAAERVSEAVPAPTGTQVADNVEGAVAPLTEAPRASSPINPKEDFAGWARENGDKPIRQIEQRYNESVNAGAPDLDFASWVKQNGDMPINSIETMFNEQRTRVQDPEVDMAGWIRDNPDAKFSEIEGMYRAASEVDEADLVARSYSTRTEVAPASNAMVIKDSNPEQARRLHQMVDEDLSGETAKAVYGASRDEALSKDILPEMGTDANLPNKVSLDPSPQFKEPEAVTNVRTMDGETYLSEVEANRLNSRIVKKLEDVNGMVPRKENISIISKPDGTSTYKMMYSFKDGGFKSPADALKSAAFNFRHLGVTEDMFTVYARRGDKWEPVTDKEVKAAKAIEDAMVAAGKPVPASIKELDYAVGVEYNYRFDPNEDVYDALSIKRNWADSLPVGTAMLTRTGQGSFTQNIVPMTMYMDPTIARSSLALTDRATRLRKVWTKQFEKFSKTFAKLPKQRREALRSYIEEANLNGIRLNYSDIKARGFSDNEYDVLKEWRKGNDILYYASNGDMAVSLRNKGYQMFQDSNGTKLVVKPVGRNAVSANTSFYDSAGNTITNMTKTDLDNFYNNGGNLSRLSSPSQINGQWVEFVKVPQNTAGGYTRAIRNDETVLNYREGYYPVMYNSEFFIEKKIRTADGEDKWIVVASSNTKNEADEFTRNLINSNSTEEYRARPDRKRTGENTKGVSEDGWTLGVNSGVSSQRVRGQRLVDTNNLANQGHQQLVDPLEAVTQQINRLSERVVMRNMLDSIKARWVSNYFDKLGLEANKYGEKFFPDDITQIKGISSTNMKLKADARTAFNYVQQLEYGFRNIIDDTFKASLHTLGDLAADLNLKVGEKAVRATSRANPTQLAKTAVFKLYLASNPLRQAIIQGHQTVQLAAINPTYLPKMFLDFYEISKVRRGLSNSPEHKRMMYEMIESGILESVDQNNLIRSDITNLAVETNLQKVGKVLNTPLNIAQRVGFDLGEQTVLVTSWLTHYDMLKKSGKTIDRRALDNVAGQSRAFTYAMNKAGDIPYNTNTLNVLFQFLQVPHKAVLQPFLDRTLTRQQRVQLLAWNTVMYGVPTYALSTMGMDITGEGAEEISDGLIDVMYNGALTAMSGEAQNLDFSDLNPVNAYGLYESIEGMLTTNIGKLMASSPAGSLVLGPNPRITNAMKKAAMWVNPFMDYEDEKLDTKYTDVVKSGAQLFSGFSNAFKARYAWQTGKKMSGFGNITDEDVTGVEAAMQLFGFRTKDEAARTDVNKVMYDGEYNVDGDVQLWYNEVKRHLASRGVSVKEQDYAQRVLSEAWTVFEEYDWKARQTLGNLIQKDFEKGDHTLFEGIRKQIGLKDIGEVKNLISKLPDSEQKRRLTLELQQYEAAVTRNKESVERRNE